MANLYDKSSLVMIPSGKKDGTVFSQKPVDGSGDFTFSRGSNLAATRVNPTGLIEKGRENLLLQSNAFNITPWVGNSITKTSGQSGYDGSNDAWLVTSTSNYTGMFQNVSSSGVHTFSAYLKDDNIGLMQLRINGSSFGLIDIDITAGVITGQAGTTIVDKGIESVGNGWYRAYIVVKDSVSSAQIIFNDLAGTSFYIQDAQLEIGLAATDYIESGATTGKAGLLEDEPRFDYSGGATCPSLLLEPSRTNLIPNSEYLIDGLTNVTATYNYGTSPDGLNNSTFILPSAAVAAHRIGYTDLFTYAPSTSYIASAFLKSGGHRYAAINLVLRNSGSFQETANGLIDLQENTIVVNGSNTLWTSLAVFKEEYANGFYRYGVTAKTPSSGSDRVDVQFNITDENGNSFAGNGTDGVVFYGLQAESGSYPTSYIPNHSGGSVTRGRDNITNVTGFSSLIGQTEGTLFLEIENSSNGTEIFSLDANTNNSIFLRSVNNLYGIYMWSDGVVWAPTTSVNINDRIRIAIAYQTDNFAVYANGVQVATNNSLTWTPNQSLDLLRFNKGGWIAALGQERYNQMMLFKERLSNADLETLTTL